MCRSCFLLTCQQETFALEFLSHMEVNDERPWENFVVRRSPFPSDRICQYTELPNMWVTENPLATQPVPLHPENITVWCRFAASFIIGPYFFEVMGAFGPVTITVTG
ncbi:DUF4817 domain-containing protein [Trichonephila clavipes]|nr:DUF4817 domain-containing protein [Trichonephila clavipes]